jgi:omega-6 fatty acid desaturase (delta-12 desaturase)
MSNAPCPSALAHLRPTDRNGVLVTAAVCAVTAAGLGLSVQPNGVMWIIGQIILAGAFLHWFVILHECGHDTLFRSRRLNAAVGTCAGLISVIPFRTWRRVHGRHHKWTGWQDLDPTTEALVPCERRRIERLAVNTCWRLWIPIFSVAYRAQNFWSLRRVLGMFPREADRRAILRDTAFAMITYIALAVAVGPASVLRLIGIALVLSLMVEDLLLLSQHTHIPQHVSGGETVRPYPAIEQATFTRSLRLPRWMSRTVLHFDAHELHHMYPFVPGYHLHRVPYEPPNEIGWWQWVTRAKRVPADVLLYENRLRTGLDV